MSAAGDPHGQPGPSRNPAVPLMRGLVHAYRLVVSPVLGPSCRFQPTCSEYALDALSKHGAARGSWLTLRRMLRCHPWGGSGWDPVPERGPPGRAQGHTHIAGGGCCGR